MVELTPNNTSQASTITVHSDREISAADQSDDRWFSRVARTLFPTKAGMALHLMTDVDERSCHRYAAGDRQPPLGFFRLLVHGEQGFTWLSAYMDGCNAQWWRDVRDAMEILDAIKRVQSTDRKG